MDVAGVGVGAGVLVGAGEAVSLGLGVGDGATVSVGRAGAWVGTGPFRRVAAEGRVGVAKAGYSALGTTVTRAIDWVTVGVWVAVDVGVFVGRVSG
jgi:hypothetical protein